MAFRNWRVGVHIQHDSLAIVALLYERSRWALRRWWLIPLAPGIVRQGVVVDVAALAERLKEWRRELPLQHRARLALPAFRTLQKHLPPPQVSLREREQAVWVANTMAQQLEMPASSLCVDYITAPSHGGWRATAAQRLEVDALRQLARRLKLQVTAIVPDACALSSFFSALPPDAQALAWRDDTRWLWATREAWGCCACSDTPSSSQLALQLAVDDLWLCCDEPAGDRGFDCWSSIQRLQPPLPICRSRFAIALGLALGGG